MNHPILVAFVLGLIVGFMLGAATLLAVIRSGEID